MYPEKFHPLLARTSPYPMGLEVDFAEGIFIHDKSGRKFIDFISGIGVSALGHGNSEILGAIQEQSKRFLHTMVYGEHVQQPQIDLATHLTSILPKHLDCCYFVNSGTEAIEAALKLAKRVTGRPEIVALSGGYHGSTHGSMSISSNEARKSAFRPLLPGVKFMEMNQLSDLDIINESAACVVLETIQGDAGVRIPDGDWMKALREKCDDAGAMLILDEIQCGLGRTGKNFAFEHFDIEPDILTLGKSLGAGLPIGAVVSSKQNLEAFTHDPMLGHITTFGGNPLVCAAAAKGLEIYNREKIVIDVEEKGVLLEQLVSPVKNVLKTRRIGLFMAVDLASEELVQQTVDQCFNKGLLVYWFLSCPKSFRIAPPLSITMEEIETAGKILAGVLNNIN